MFVEAQSFDGVPISGDLPTAVSRFKSKGYKVKNYMEHGVIMTGRVSLWEVELFIFTTPRSKKVFKMTVYFPEETSWYSLKKTYNQMLNIMKDKYGEPSAIREEFVYPYYEGDGYEMSAVKNEKVQYFGLWVMETKNMNVAVEISKYKQVQLTYENDELMKVKDREQASLNSISF
jgi:hypothetical protein